MYEINYDHNKSVIGQVKQYRQHRGLLILKNTNYERLASSSKSEMMS